MGKYYLTVFILLSFQQIMYPQVEGIIRDASTGIPVPGATVIFRESGTGSVSNADGFFETDLSGEAVIRAVGYKAKNLQLLPEREQYLFFLEQEYYNINEVVVEAFARSRRLVDVPGSLSLIPARQIERENPVTVVPLLNQVPGVYAHSGTLNTSRITIRGIGARVPYATGKVRAYLNNIPLTNGSGISIVEDIDPSVMESIEIIKGPATSAYGAGLGGTLILKAKDPLMRPANITNSFQAGSWDLYRNTVSIDTGTDRYGLSLLYNHTQSDGYRDNNEYRRDGLTAITHANPIPGTNLTLLLNYTSLKAHIPSSIDSLTFRTSPRSAASNWLQTKGYEDYDKFLAGISADFTSNSGLSANLSLFSTLNSEKEMRPFDVLNEERLSGGTRAKIVWSDNLLSGSYQLLGGGELFTENYKYMSHENIGGIGQKGGMISNNDEVISYYNVFVQGDLDLNRLKLSAGINFNSSRTDYRDLFYENGLNPSGRYSYGTIISPRISANYRYYQSNSAFLTISHGFSPPSLAETLTPDGFINTGIQPETSRNIEGGIRGNLFDHTLFYDVNLYRMQVSNLLVAERTAEDTWVGKNAGESVHNGLEAEIQYVLYESPVDNLSGWWQPSYLSVSWGLTFNRFLFTDFIDGGTDYSGNRLPGIPDMFSNLNFYARMGGGLYSSLNLRHTGKMPMNDANSLHTEPYILTGVTAGYSRSIYAGFDADIFLSASNIFDTKYASMILVNAPEFGNRPPRHYYPGQPLNFSAGIKVSYRFH